jgi:NAD(P)H dehydrogenase (quinone)
MVDPGQAGATLTATGPAALTNAEVCEALSRGLGRAIKYVDQTPSEYEQTLTAHGAPGWYAHAEVALGEIVRAGIAREVTGTVARLTGREPRPIDDYIRANAAAFAR